MSARGSLRFTYEDDVQLPDDGRCEVIDGELFPAPAPTPYHQIVAKRLGFLLSPTRRPGRSRC